MSTESVCCKSLDSGGMFPFLSSEEGMQWGNKKGAREMASWTKRSPLLVPFIALLFPPLAFKCWEVIPFSLITAGCSCMLMWRVWTLLWSLRAREEREQSNPLYPHSCSRIKAPQPLFWHVTQVARTESCWMYWWEEELRGSMKEPLYTPFTAPRASSEGSG